MKKHSSNRSGILLMEIIIAILFFSVASAVCLQLFVKSHNLSKESEVLNYAVNESTSVAECIRAGNGTLTILEKQYSNLEKQDGTYFIYYDSNFHSIPNDKSASYFLEIIPSEIDETTASYSIAVYKTNADASIYTLSVTTYTQATR